MARREQDPQLITAALGDIARSTSLVRVGLCPQTVSPVMHMSETRRRAARTAAQTIRYALCVACGLAGTSVAREAGAEPPAAPFEISVPGTGDLVTVTEGPGEPRSIGSYAVRLYAPLNPDWPHDNFADGVVRRRDGVVERVLVDDIDGDGRADAVVVVRSVGSGGYQSAAAFALDRGKLRFLGEVGGLPSGADPVRALRETYATPP